MSSELDRFDSYRVGDAERAGTVDLLKEAHVAGYLTLAEIDERLSAALAARTRADLEPLLTDLPPEWRARQEGKDGQGDRPAAPPQHAGRPAALRLLLPLVVGLVIVALVVLAVTRGFFFPWPLLWMWFVFGRRYRSDRYRSDRYRSDRWRQPPDPPHRVTWV